MPKIINYNIIIENTFLNKTYNYTVVGAKGGGVNAIVKLLNKHFSLNIFTNNVVNNIMSRRELTNNRYDSISIFREQLRSIKKK